MPGQSKLTDYQGGETIAHCPGDFCRFPMPLYVVCLLTPIWSFVIFPPAFKKALVCSAID